MIIVRVFQIMTELMCRRKPYSLYWSLCVKSNERNSIFTFREKSPFQFIQVPEYKRNIQIR